MNRILIVEDSATQAQALEFILKAEEFEVDVARDAETGCERLAGSAFDLVISDILMPGMSGFELCRKVKSSPTTRHVPVILLTSLNDPLDIIQGLEAGADNFITKPYEASQLVARVNTILAHRSVPARASDEREVEIFFLGKKFKITSGKQQILDLLISTFEDTVRTNRELQASQVALAAANQELEAFSYSVSHDLRAPLRAIDGFSHALVEDCAGELGATGLAHLERIRASALRMGQLIEDLLALARVSRGELRRTGVRVDELAQACARELECREPARQVEWLLTPGARAHADPSLLKIVLENLLANAWKFTRHVAHSRIEVGHLPRRAEREKVYFVRDNGAGFDMKDAAKLFAPFQRLHSASDFEGTGVGLATVQRIIHRHGGRIWSESEPGRGATFFFTLGAAEAEGSGA